ncbi:lipoate--protein ligase [Roseburia hominis]
MVEKITYIESMQPNPYRNLAVEEYLFLHCEDTECILYLWQNQNTIVIGRNQNAWKECLVSSLEADGGHLARRLSGGGAVYHDLGNLNFTFLVSKENYDLEKQLEVIKRAVQKLGGNAEKSGRNDILIDGRKFSGNAFYEHGTHCYHHGTLMVDVDIENLSKYLTVSKEKLKSKGVDSVKSRVANLKEYIPNLTIEALKAALRAAFEEVYGLKAGELRVSALKMEEVEESEKRFSSWKWLYGRKLDFQHELSYRFPWGQLTLQFMVEEGKVADVNVYSDSLKPELMGELPKYLKGIRYHNKSLAVELGLYWSEDQDQMRMMNDIVEWIRSVEL